MLTDLLRKKIKVKMMKETQEEAATMLLENMKINKEEEEQQQEENEEPMAFVEIDQRSCYCGG
jgi:hypothetical protein